MAYVFDIAEKELKARPATLEDSRMLWGWRNDPETRQRAFEADEIPFENHEKWFANRVDSETTRFFIIENSESTPMGVIRFDIDSGISDIAIYIDKPEQGKGYGTAVIRTACQYGFDSLGIEKYQTYIRTDNPISIAVFKKLGFTEKTDITHKDRPAVEMVLEKPTA